MVLLKELAAMFERHGDVPCRFEVAEDDVAKGAEFRVTVVPAETVLDATELVQDAKYLSGLCGVRMFARDYGIDPAALEKLLPGTAEAEQGREREVRRG